jgi:hypothetical protein
MVDPISLATVTAALTLLGTECAKGIASQAGKEIWSKAKGLLGWTTEPDTQELPKAIATKLQVDQALLDKVITLLHDAEKTDASVQMIGSLVGSLTAERAIIAQKIEGGIKM